MTRIRLQLLLGLVVDAARWQLQVAPGRLSYWARPYCWRLDDRHWRWQHRRCRCAPDWSRSARCSAALEVHRSLDLNLTYGSTADEP